MRTLFSRPATVRRPGTRRYQLLSLYGLVVLALLPLGCRSTSPVKQTPAEVQAADTSAERSVRGGETRAEETADASRHAPQPSEQAAHGAAAGEPPSTIEVVAAWRLGETRTLEVQHARLRYQDNALTSEQRSTSRIRLTVEDTTDVGGYVLRWTCLDYEANYDTFQALQADQTLMQQAQNLDLVYRVTPWGAYQDLVNSNELVAFMATLIDSLVTAEVDAGVRTQMQGFMDTFTDEAFLEQAVSQEPQLFHSLHGYAFDVRETWTYEDLLPNLLGGEPIPARGVTQVIDVDPETATFSVRNTLTADPEAYGAMVRDVLKRIGLPPAEVERQLAATTFEMEDDNRYVIDYARGWVRSLDRVRVVSAPGIREEQHLEILLLDE